MATTAAIYYHPDLVERASTPLVGRRAAGSSFLKGYMQHVQAEELHCVADAQKSIEEFKDLCLQNNWTKDVTGRLMSDPDAIQDPGTLFVPGPSLGTFAWDRRRHKSSYSICGITHTLSTKTIQSDLSEVLFSPVESWDAIICTSTAAKGVVENHFEEVSNYLGQRFEAQSVCRPQLPVIPLGIDTARYAANPNTRKRLRDELNISEDEIVLMTMGRLSLAEKMNPGPMLLALERAARISQQKFVLFMVGWFSDKTTEKLHRNMAKTLAPSIRVMFLDGKDNALRFDTWSAADIFTLPVDNVQETFGLAPIEGMAAGLPVICSDWNGFKDTVEHGVTGFRIKTIAPFPGTGSEIAARYGAKKDQYSQYLISISQQVCIDISEYCDAIITLAKDASLRQKMGHAGLQRAKRLFDWSAVIPQYQDLWAELTDIRQRALSHEAAVDVGPVLSEIDPFQLYKHYPSTTISPEMVLSAAIQAKQQEVVNLLLLTGAKTYRKAVATPENFISIQNAIFQLGPVTLGDLAGRTDAPFSDIASIVLWLAKYGLIKIHYDAGENR